MKKTSSKKKWNQKNNTKNNIESRELKSSFSEFKKVDTVDNILSGN